ncbi:MAG: arylsulfotransferase family protein [Geminicoccaceae bacterium]
MENTLPKILFVFALMFFSFVYGVLVMSFQLFPYHTLRSANVTAKTMLKSFRDEQRGTFIEFADLPADQVSERRLTRFDASATGETFLIAAGDHQFRDHCPEKGCAAVEVSAAGNLVHAYPFVPERIFAGNVVAELPFEDDLFEPMEDLEVAGIDRFPNGDLIMTFGTRQMTFPYSGGLARIDRNGHAVWYRRDYSHHWPHITESGEVMVPSMTVADPPLDVTVQSHSFPIECNGRIYMEAVNIVDGDGEMVQQVPVMEALIASPFAAVLMQTTNPCDPLHINFVREVGPGIAQVIDGVEADDLMVSMRNVSAIGFLDRQTNGFNHIVRGSFIQQHAVQPAGDARLVMFDNFGGGLQGGPSRLLMIDLATGEEITILPTDEHGSFADDMFSWRAGNVDVSSDNSRALISFTYTGVTFEVELQSGEILARFENVHDVRGSDAFSQDEADRAALFRTYGVHYVDGQKTPMADRAN